MSNEGYVKKYIPPKRRGTYQDIKEHVNQRGKNADIMHSLICDYLNLSNYDRIFKNKILPLLSKNSAIFKSRSVHGYTLLHDILSFAQFSYDQLEAEKRRKNLVREFLEKAKEKGILAELFFLVSKNGVCFTHNLFRLPKETQDIILSEVKNLYRENQGIKEELAGLFYKKTKTGLLPIHLSFKKKDKEFVRIAINQLAVLYKAGILEDDTLPKCLGDFFVNLILFCNDRDIK